MQPEEIAGIAFCVSNHIEFYGLTTASDALLFCNRDPVLLTRMIRLFEYDVDGSIMDCGIPSYESNRKLIADCHELLRTAETPRQEELPGKRIHLLCGLPRDEKKAFAGKIPDSYTVSLNSLCGIEEESQLPELEDQPEIRQQAIRELQLESVHSVLLLSGYFLTRHSRRHMLSLLREAFPGVPVVCDYFLGRTPENQADMACLFQHLPSALYETEFSSIFIRVSA